MKTRNPSYLAAALGLTILTACNGRVTGNPEGDSGIIDPSSYDQGCKEASDCAWIAKTGNCCDESCATAGISESALSTYEADYAAHCGGIGCPEFACLAPSVACVAGKCEAIGGGPAPGYGSDGGEVDGGEVDGDGGSCTQGAPCAAGSGCGQAIDGPPGGSGIYSCTCVDGALDCTETDIGATDAQTTACTVDADCGKGSACGFPEADACSAVGTCFPTGPICKAYGPGCACDGTTISVVCTGLPSGYVSKPLDYEGSCRADGGAAPDAGTSSDGG